jgi:hypothetical protein
MLFCCRVVLDGGTAKSKPFDFGSKKSKSYLTRTNALWVQTTTPSKFTLSYKTYGMTAYYETTLELINQMLNTFYPFTF